MLEWSFPGGVNPFFEFKTLAHLACRRWCDALRGWWLFMAEALSCSLTMKDLLVSSLSVVVKTLLEWDTSNAPLTWKMSWMWLVVAFALRTCAYGVQHRRCPFAPLRFVLDRQNLGRFVVLNLIHNSFQAVDAEWHTMHAAGLVSKMTWTFLPHDRINYCKKQNPFYNSFTSIVS